MGLEALLDKLVTKHYRQRYIKKLVEKKDVNRLISFLVDVDPAIDPDRKLRTEATEGLVSIVQHDEHALIDMFRDIFKSNVFGFPAKATEVLAGIGEPVVPALVEALKYKNEDVRQLAAEALGKIGPEAKEAIPALIEALKDKNEQVRQYAAGALYSIGPEAKEAIPALIEALKDKVVRQYAADALGSIGPEAKEATGPLLEFLFAYAREYDETLAEPLLAISPNSAISKDVIEDAVKASSYEFFKDQGTDDYVTSLDESNNAIRRLCQIKSPVTSNLLHLVCKKKNKYITDPKFPDTNKLHLDFELQREMARDELKRRGSPAYDPTAFLATT